MSETLRIAVTVTAYIPASLITGYSNAAKIMRAPVVANINFQQITRDPKAGDAIREKSRRSIQSIKLKSSNNRMISR